MATIERLTHNERQILRPVLARYAQWSDAHDGPVFEAVERILTARLEPFKGLADELDVSGDGVEHLVQRHVARRLRALLDAAPAGGAET